ncbi:hypothetical protein AVEN_274899-1 [Araneus ventricosus]|uniref:Uncharacterized protein n=1 Tax=Araneus ventricosus TaxID=182803 RepID=A0A4Y2TH10_ARAVE|nr:hypothetical protein AVEN_274899-1 [Araneus ventricosus]
MSILNKCLSSNALKQGLQLKVLTSTPSCSYYSRKDLDKFGTPPPSFRELMKELPLYASNAVQDSEKEACDLEIHNFQNDNFCGIVEESVDLWWRISQNILYFPGWHLLC